MVAVPDTHGNSRLVAFVAPLEGAEVGQQLVEELRQLVRDQFSLAAYPREITFLAELPRTSTGKLDRRRLAELAGTAPGSRGQADSGP